MPSSHAKRALVSDPRYIAHLEQAKKRPAVLIALTNYCNFHCVYCGTSQEKPARRIDMDFELFKGLVDQCGRAGITPFFGQTYEPFAHPRIE